MVIEVFGVGCSKCERLKENVEAAVKKAGVDAEIRYVTDITEMMKRGVSITPALAISGRIVAAGKILSVDRIVEKIKESLRG